MYKIFSAIDTFVSKFNADTTTYVRGGVTALIMGLCITVGFMYVVYVNPVTTVAHNAIQENKILKAKVAVLESKYFETEHVTFASYNTNQKALSVSYDKQKEEVIRAKATVAVGEAIKKLMGPNYKNVDHPIVYEISAAFYDMSKKYNHDVRELLGIAWHENRFNPYRRSSVGACGLMQIMPLHVSGKTKGSRQFMLETGINSVEELCNDNKKNIEAAAWIYRDYKNIWIRRGIKSKREVARLAQLTYNRGPRAMYIALNDGFDPSNGYDRVIRKKVNLLTRTGFFVQKQVVTYEPLNLSY